MREIKFRGYVIEELTGSQWVTNGYGIAKIKYVDNSPTDYILLTPYGNYAVYKESIGEYTGYKDINDIEICEGDIVETTRALNHIIGEVVLYKGCWYIKDYNGGYYRLIPRFGIAENKIIGNIYENKNLLEVK